MATQFAFDKAQFPSIMNLRLAAVYADVSEQRLRTLVREGTVPEAAKDDAGAWSFTKEGLDLYLASKGTTPRKGGGGKAHPAGKAWVIHVPAEKYQALKAALDTLGIVLEQRYDYAKQADYRVKRNIELKAKKQAAANVGIAPAPSANQPANPSAKPAGK